MLKNVRRAVLGAVNIALDTLYGGVKKALHMPMKDRPPLMLHEVTGHYMGGFEPDRKIQFVVSLVVGYDPRKDKVKSPIEAAAAALDLTRDEFSGETMWIVYDRSSRKKYHFKQAHLEPELDIDLEEIADKAIEAVEREQGALEAAKELAKLVVPAVIANWGEGGRALADTDTPPESITDDQGTQAWIRLYRSARALLDRLEPDYRDTIEDLERRVEDELDADPLSTLERISVRH